MVISAVLLLVAIDTAVLAVHGRSFGLVCLVGMDVAVFFGACSPVHSSVSWVVDVASSFVSVRKENSLPLVPLRAPSASHHTNSQV